MTTTNATVTYIGPFGLTATLDLGQPHPNATFEVQIHELYSPGVVQRHKIGDRIHVCPGQDGVEASLSWVEVLDGPARLTALLDAEQSAIVDAEARRGYSLK